MLASSADRAEIDHYVRLLGIAELLTQTTSAEANHPIAIYDNVADLFARLPTSPLADE